MSPGSRGPARRAAPWRRPPETAVGRSLALVAAAWALLATGAACTVPNPAFGRGAHGDGSTLDGRLGGRFDARDTGSAADGGDWDLTTGLIGYWKMDDGPGKTMAVDSSGYGHHGLLEGMDASTAWVASPRGMALQIPDTKGAGVKVLSSAAILGIERFTVAAWVRREVVNGTYQTIISRQVDSTTLEVFNLAFHGTDVALLLARSSPPPGGTSEWEYWVRQAMVAPAGQWLHVAGSFDGATARLYLNGTHLASVSYPRPLPKASAPLYLGTNKNPNTEEPLGGQLDDVLLYGVALPSGAIAALARGAVPRRP
jgi:hypothetical protein